MTFRKIPFCPECESSRDGVVQHAETKKRFTLQTISAPHDVVHLGVQIGGWSNVTTCWEIISATFYPTPSDPVRLIHVLIPRDGNFLNIKEDNLFPFEVSTNCRIRYTSDIHGVWRAAMVEQVPCNKMAERLNLPQFGAHEFRVLIGEILLAGIR